MRINFMKNRNLYLKRQKGQATVELVMSILFFVAMLCIILGLSLYLYVQHIFISAAKEGVRVAAIQRSFATDPASAAGLANVRNRVRGLIPGSTTLILRDQDIQVSGPNPANDPNAVGNRTITVTLNGNFRNPIQIRNFLNTLGGGSSGPPETITITSRATMRYEE